MTKFPLVAILCLSIANVGCATSGRRASVAAPATRAADSEVMASYVRQLPVGSRVRVTLTDGRRMHGTLMSTGDPVVLQKRTRIPEAPIEIALAGVRAVELEGKSGSTGRAIALGAAAGAASALGVLMVLAAIFAD